MAPNRFHHLSVGEWRDAFPGARVFVPEGFEKKRPDLRDVTVMRADDPPSFEGIELEVVRGVPLANETVFFHPASATLILTDLAFNVGPEATFPRAWPSGFGAPTTGSVPRPSSG